mmetsp:Transcript_115407/g.224413  ORF Transcript_115407/g.224413 Transcript_115407/m.224413 type:complete len:222 (+) Transcript_115407:59-724(+)
MRWETETPWLHTHGAIVHTHWPKQHGSLWLHTKNELHHHGCYAQYHELHAGQLESGILLGRSSLAVFPRCDPDRTIQQLDDALPVLLPVFPEPFVPPTIGPKEQPKAMLYVLLILTTVLLAVLPVVNARAVDHRIKPHATEARTVVAEEHPHTTHAVCLPRTLVARQVGPMINAISLFVAIDKLALVLRISFPNLYTTAMLNISMPLATVAGDLVTVDVST